MKNFYKTITINENQKYFFYHGAGDKLEEFLYKGNRNLIKMLIDAGYNKDNILKNVDERLRHNEIAWRYSFNYAFNEFYNK